MSEDKLFECVKCKKSFKEEEGVMIWDNAAFCCKECKKNMDDDKDHGHDDDKENEVCEFC